jgi:hypothetical protein
VAVENGSCRTGVAPDGLGCDELGYPAPCSDTPLAARGLMSAKAPRAGDTGDVLASAVGWVAPALRVAAALAFPPAPELSDLGRTQRSSILRL